MRKLFKIIIFLHLFLDVNAQEFKFDLGYKYLYSGQWDKAIQTYNFSRPDLTQKQPLLINGFNSSVSCIFKSSKKIQHGLNVSYSYFRSYAENEKLINQLNLHFVNVGYLVHYENKVKLKGLYTDIILSAISSGIFRNVNDAPFVFDEKKSKAFGIGGEINVKFGYYVKLKNKSYFSPYISFGYTPYLFSPYSESVINETKGLSSKNWTSVSNTQVGVVIHIKKGENDQKQ